MNRDLLSKLEDYIFEHKIRPNVAASMMADFIGVMIGIKPAAIGNFEAEEFLNIDPEEIFGILDQVGLKALFFKQEYISAGKLVWIEDIYVSRNIKTATELRQSFMKLRSTMDDMGQIFDKKAWEESSREIGHLLGYPSTAIEYFIAEQDIDNEERLQLMNRYQFYIHSPEHHEQEYQAYDQKIDQAIRDYAPKTARFI